MKLEPLISVIIPVYKVEKFLDQCVTSVVEQSYKNLEILLVDDGSPDRCPEMCDSWMKKDPRIKVLHKENGGLSDARNAGMASASGDYLSFVDSDDWIDPFYYETLAASIKENHAQIAASAVVKSYEDHEELQDEILEQKVFSAEEALDVFLNGKAFFCVAWNKLYDRRCFDDVKFPVGKINEDEFVIYRVMGKAQTLVLCQNAKYFYRQRPGSIMSSQAGILNLDFLEAYSGRIQFFEDNFPELCRKDKVGYCLACTVRYRAALAQMADPEILRRILEYRRKVKIRLSELSFYTMKEKIYILGSGINIDLFAKILNLRGIPN